MSWRGREDPEDSRIDFSRNRLDRSIDFDRSREWDRDSGRGGWDGGERSRDRRPIPDDRDERATRRRDRRNPFFEEDRFAPTLGANQDDESSESRRRRDLSLRDDVRRDDVRIPGEVATSKAADVKNLDNLSYPYSARFSNFTVSPEDIVRDPLQPENDAGETTSMMSSKSARSSAVFVESLLTGKFRRMDDDGDYTPLGMKDPDEVIDTEEYDYRKEEEEEFHMMDQAVKSIATRLAVTVLFSQGLLAGVALLHVYLVYWSADNAILLTFYSPISSAVGQIYFVLTLAALLGSLDRVMKERADYYLNPLRPDSTKRFAVLVVCFVGYLISFISTLANIPFDNVMQYTESYTPKAFSNTLSDSFLVRLSLWRFFTFVRVFSLLISWLCVIADMRWQLAGIATTVYSTPAYELYKIPYATAGPLLPVTSPPYDKGDKR